MNEFLVSFYFLFFESRLGYVLQIMPFMFLVGIIFWLVRGQYLKKRKLERAEFPREFCLLIFACYLSGLIALVCTPRNFWVWLWFYIIWGWSGTHLSLPFSGGFNLVPSIFKYLSGKYTLTSISWAAFMLYGNALLFLPFGLLLPTVWKKASATKTIYLGLTTSLVIELIQPIVGRSFDIDDLLTNTLGTAIGYALFIIVNRIISKKKGT